MRLLLPMLLAACADPPPPEAAPVVVEEAVVEEVVVDEAAPNQAPRITSITISPSSPLASQDLTVTVETSDAEGDAVDVDQVWVINDEPQISEIADTLSHDRFKKGDRIAVKVTASDAEGSVEQVSGSIVIQNAPPLFLTDPRSVKKLDGMRLEGQDPDGDPLTWSMSGAPAGMVIDAQKGVISYKGTAEEPGGDYRIKVQLSDGGGGQAEWEAGITIAPGSTAAAAAKKAAGG
jgi:large repetitive protein